MDRLQKVAKTLTAHGQHALAREVAEVSLQMKCSSGMTLKDLDEDFQFEEMDKGQQELVKALITKMKWPVESISEGGGSDYAVTCKVSPAKLSAADMKWLGNHPNLDWLRADGSTLTVGIKG